MSKLTLFISTADTNEIKSLMAQLGMKNDDQSFTAFIKSLQSLVKSRENQQSS